MDKQIAELNQRLAELDTEIVARAEGFAFTRTELREAFERVENREHWKLPIDTRVAIVGDRQRVAIAQAVIFFAGCEAEISRIGRTPLFHVRAIGYYAAIGA